MDDLEREMLHNIVGDARVGGRYVVERVLGLGGMGLVAAARYPELDQEVAIKFMRPQLALDATLSARFLREARLAARAKSPHFVRVFDFGKLDTGVPYLVMEMLTGHDLGAELREMGPLPIDQAVDYVLQASLGLAELHAMGVVHRDLKPSNLFLADAAGTRTLKVLDLGLITDPGKGAQGLTSTGHVFGTPHYMSPEQIKESKSVDARSDVWALGVILYELLTGSLPFGQGAESTGEVFGLILHTEPLALREQRPALPAGIEAVVHRCLRRAPEERYPNLAELGAALVPFGGPIAGERVDGIRKALAAKPADPPRAPEHDLPSGAAGDVSSAPTVQATPGGPAPMRPPVVRTPAPALPARGTARAEVPTGAGPFAKALTPPPAPPKTVGRGMVIGIAVGAVVLVPVLVFALRGHGAPAASLQPTAAETAPAPSALAATPMASTPPAATTIASTTPASTSAIAAGTGSTLAAGKPAPGAGATSPAPHTSHAAAAAPHGAPAATGPARQPASVLDGLDRK